MVERIYEQLRTPKTLDEVYTRLNEIGIGWNRSQVQLFLEMDKNVINKNGLWRVEGGGKKEIILDIIDKVLGNKPVVPVKLVMSSIPNDVITSAEEIGRIVEESDMFFSPNNGASIKRK